MNEAFVFTSAVFVPVVAIALYLGHVQDDGPTHRPSTVGAASTLLAVMALVWAFRALQRLTAKRAVRHVAELVFGVALLLRTLGHYSAAVTCCITVSEEMDGVDLWARDPLGIERPRWVRFVGALMGCMFAAVFVPTLLGPLAVGGVAGVLFKAWMLSNAAILLGGLFV